MYTSRVFQASNVTVVITFKQRRSTLFKHRHVYVCSVASGITNLSFLYQILNTIKNKDIPVASMVKAAMTP